MKIKVFIVTIQEFVDGHNETFETLAYPSREEAQSRFDLVVGGTRKAYEGSGYVEDPENSDHCFEIYEDGYYAHNHVTVTITESDIEIPEPERPVIIVPPAGEEEVIDIYLNEVAYPVAYRAKMDELREQGAFENDEQARKWLRQTPITLELVFEKHHGLFAVESAAFEGGPLMSPYSGAEVRAPEE